MPPGIEPIIKYPDRAKKITPIQPMPMMPACEAIMPRTEGRVRSRRSLMQRSRRRRRRCWRGEARLGAKHIAARGNGADVSLDLRPEAKAREEGAPLYRCGGVMKFCRS